MEDILSTQVERFRGISCLLVLILSSDNEFIAINGTTVENITSEEATLLLCEFHDNNIWLHLLAHAHQISANIYKEKSWPPIGKVLKSIDRLGEKPEKMDSVMSGAFAEADATAQDLPVYATFKGQSALPKLT